MRLSPPSEWQGPSPLSDQVITLEASEAPVSPIRLEGLFLHRALRTQLVSILSFYYASRECLANRQDFFKI